MHQPDGDTEHIWNDDGFDEDEAIKSILGATDIGGRVT